MVNRIESIKEGKMYPKEVLAETDSKCVFSKNVGGLIEVNGVSVDWSVHLWERKAVSTV